MIIKKDIKETTLTINTGTNTIIEVIKEDAIGSIDFRYETASVKEEASFSGSLDSGTMILELRGLNTLKYSPSGSGNNYCLILEGYKGTGIMTPKEIIFRATLKTDRDIGIKNILGSNKIYIRVGSPFKLR